MRRRYHLAIAMVILITSPIAMSDEPKPVENNSEPVWLSGVAVNDAAKAVAYARLTSVEKQEVDNIRRKLKNKGFADSGLTWDEINFAYTGAGRECLFIELGDAVKSTPDKCTAECKNLLHWDNATAVAFACDTDISPHEHRLILFLAKLLVNRDQKLNDYSIRFIRDHDRYLGATFDNYNKLGIDPVKVAEREKREAEEQKLAVEKLRNDLATKKKELPDLEKQRANDFSKVDQLGSKLLKLQGVNQPSKSNEQARDKLLADLKAAKDQLDASQRALDDCKSEINKLESTLSTYDKGDK